MKGGLIAFGQFTVQGGCREALRGGGCIGAKIEAELNVKRLQAKVQARARVCLFTPDNLFVDARLLWRLSSGKFWGEGRWIISEGSKTWCLLGRCVSGVGGD